MEIAFHEGLSLWLPLWLLLSWDPIASPQLTQESPHRCARGSVAQGSPHWDCYRLAEGSKSSGSGWEDACGRAPWTELLSQTPQVSY